MYVTRGQYHRTAFSYSANLCEGFDKFSLFIYESPDHGESDREIYWRAKASTNSVLSFRQFHYFTELKLEQRSSNIAFQREIEKNEFCCFVKQSYTGADERVFQKINSHLAVTIKKLHI